VNVRQALAPAARLGYLDGLRAVAVLLVVVFHARVHLPGVRLEEFFKECSHGVDLFFVLSGFCLARPTLEKLARAGSAPFDLAGYAAKRVLRILPPYAAAVGAFAALGGFLMSHNLPLPPGMQPFGAADVASELLFMDQGLQHINASFWSLAVEFRWYFLFPLMLALWVRSQRSFLAVLVLVIVASELTRATSTDVGVMPAFLLGIVAAGLALREHPVVRYAPLLCLACIIFALLNEQRYHFPIQTNVGWHLASFFFVLYAGYREWLRRLLSSRALVTVGTASYSIYLVHEPIVGAVVSALGARIGGPPAMIVAAAAGVGGGFAFWSVVERPLTAPSFVAEYLRRIRPSFGRLLEIADVPETFAQHDTHVDRAGASHESSPVVVELHSVRELETNDSRRHAIRRA